MRLIRDVLHHILDPAIQYPAKHLNGVRAHALIALHTRDLAGTDMMLVDERILRDSP